MTPTQHKPICCLLLCCLWLSSCAAPHSSQDGLQDMGALTAHMTDPADQAIRDLAVWENNLYVAYGDAPQRSGPLPTLRYDLTKQHMILDKNDPLNQHSIEVWRQFDGALWTPGLAPCAPQPTLGQRFRSLFQSGSTPTPSGHVYVRRTVQDDWQRLTLADTLSIQDVISYAGAWYAAGTGIDQTSESSGSRHAYAAIYCSSDQGSSWSLVHKEETLLQFTELHVYLNKLYATVGPITRVFDGQNWTSGHLLPENSGVVRKRLLFQRLLVLLPDLSWQGPLFLYDGQETHAIGLPGAVRDAVVVGDWLYVLTSNSAGQMALWETNDTRCRCPASFTLMRAFELGAPATALAYADGHFYIGAQDGHLYRVTAWR